jgi:signal transduction histidine kinase
VSVLPPVAEALARCVGTGVLIAAGDVVVAVNDEFLGLFDAPGESVAGLRLADVAAREPFRAAAELWAARDQPGRRRRCRLPGDRVVEVRWHPLPSDDGPLVAAVVTDLTAETRVRASLRSHNRALAELVATKTELVSAMLHELRTPLAAGLAMADLLPEETGDPALDEALALIVRNVRRIHAVTAEIATISGIENGSVPLEQKEFDLAELLSSCGFAVAAGPSGVVGDRERLAEVFRRLVAAVRALGGDDTMIAEPRGERWRIALRLPSRQASDRLFTFSESGGNATALMLARAVIGRHGGTVGVQSADGTPYLVVSLPRSARRPG